MSSLGQWGMRPFAGLVAFGREPRRLAILVVALVGLLLPMHFAERLAVARACADLQARASAAATLDAAVLRSELEKHRSLPFVLAEDSDVIGVLQTRNPQSIATLNVKLERLAAQTRAAVVYVLDPSGVAIAASNWRLPSSFVGSNYGYRPYFIEALAGRAPEHFALGAVSRHPGLFLARRVTSGGHILGVVVVKVEFDGLEREWRASGNPAFVTEAKGIILVTSMPDWRFRTVQALDPAERARLSASLQFGGSALPSLPISPSGKDELRVSDPNPVDFMSATVPAPVAGWTLHLLTATGPTIAAAVLTARLVVFLVGTLSLLLIWTVLARSAVQQRVRRELEARVDERTSALKVANERLILEMEERRRIEVSRQVVQEELVQANKLATLGQIAAGVAHEINQPVAAIRSFADNATILLDQHQLSPARENLGIIAQLTEKIGLITSELRAFSRKTKGAVGPIELDDAISGALLLIGWRSREQAIRIERAGAVGLQVMAERVRLEQVLVNLLQNALDALDGTSTGVIRLEVMRAGSKVRIRIEDNGPGMDTAIAEGLFTPFVTSKVSGLGLGLVISRDLVADFGGDLAFEHPTGNGAAFVITLRNAA